MKFSFVDEEKKPTKHGIIVVFLNVSFEKKILSKKNSEPNTKRTFSSDYTKYTVHQRRECEKKFLFCLFS
jgi:hypothetical protein